MNIQESIRRILKEETKLNPMILRRVSFDELETEFADSLEDVEDRFKRNYGTLDLDYKEGLRLYTRLVISGLIDAIHWHIHSTTPDDAFWYDEVFKSLKNHYQNRIELKYRTMKRYNSRS